MNSYLQPLKNGVGFRLVPKNSSSHSVSGGHLSAPQSSTSNKDATISRTKSGRVTKTGRGRKSGQSLKFHNFVANDCSARLGDGQDSERPTHCLREEHGTKQITVSHWKSAPEESAPSEEKKNPNLVQLPRIETKTSRKLKNQSSDLQRQSILETLLAKRYLAEMGQRLEAELAAPKIDSRTKNKRKPLVVRRLLTQSDEVDKAASDNSFEAERHERDVQEEPLDLSTKRIKTPRTASKSLRHEANLDRDPIQKLIRSVEESAAQAASIMASVSGNSSMPHLNQSRSSSAVSGNSAASFGHVMFDHERFRRIDVNGESDPDKNKGNTHQRSVIKQKLEDAFRQNGFLVKTKQVSDGEATFCKFRQLRKYTRYYLKSLAQTFAG